MLSSGYQQLDSAVSIPWTNTAAFCTPVASTDLGRGNIKLVFGQTFCTAGWSSTEISPLFLFKTELEFLENPQCMLLARLSIKYILAFFQSVCIYQKKTLVETMYKASKNSSIKKKMF